MKKVLLSATLLSLLSLAFSSCKKGIEEDDEPEIIECEHTYDKIAGVYKILSSKKITTNGEVDVTRELHEACELDNLTQLKADQTTVYTDAGTSCGGPATVNGTWLVNGDFFKVNGWTANIESFDCSKLVLNYRDDDSNLITETWGKQN